MCWLAPPISWNLQGSHVGKDLTIAFSGTLVFSNNSWSIGQNAPPPPNRKCLGASLPRLHPWSGYYANFVTLPSYQWKNSASGAIVLLFSWHRCKPNTFTAWFPNCQFRFVLHYKLLLRLASFHCISQSCCLRMQRHCTTKTSGFSWNFSRFVHLKPVLLSLFPHGYFQVSSWQVWL